MPRPNLPAVIRDARLTFKNDVSKGGSEHPQLLEGMRGAIGGAPSLAYIEECNLANLQRYACLIYGSSRSPPRLGRKVTVIA